MVTKFPSLAKKILYSFETIRNLFLIYQSGLFDKDWYLAHNPDVKQAKRNAMLHYLRHGGFEGRDPGPRFSSSNYLQTYEDVRKAHVNPLIHYLKYGQKEGRLAQPEAPEQHIEPVPPYECPVCKNPVEAFVPLSSFYLENVRQYGYPYTFAEAETLNSEQYTCPHCGASDRDRLYACYLEKRLSQYPPSEQLLLLDIAPSVHLGRWIDRLENVVHHTGDLFTEGVDFALDITNMPEIESDSYDILICSHVLEHVSDDRKALAELYRVLKPGGWGIIMVPIILTLDQIDEDPKVTDVAERWRRFGQYDHVRLYNKPGFVGRVEAAGFDLKQLGVDYFGESIFRRYGITNQSVLYIAEKQRAAFSKVRRSLISEDKSDDSSPILTVIIIAYNHVGYIANAINSVLEQQTTYPYEIWISDDCSTDGTLEICNSYAEKHPDKIKVIAHPVNTFSTPGVIPHNETTLKSVKTKYYCVFDGDDAWCDSQKIQTALDFLETNLEYTTFAHDTWYHDTATGTSRSLVHDILKADIHNPVHFETAPYLHTSARVYRNVVKYTGNRKVIGDIFLYYSYLDKGPLYYYDKVMSIYNMTGKGVWSSLSRSGRDNTLVTTQYELNRYFDYQHDEFFTKRAGNTQGLEPFKKIFGKRLGWEFWYRLVFQNVRSLANLKFNTKRFTDRILGNSTKHE